MGVQTFGTLEWVQVVWVLEQTSYEVANVERQTPGPFLGV